MTPRSSRIDARRIFASLGIGLAAAIGFVLALVLGALLHLGVPAPRRVVAVRVSALLGTILEGDVAIERVGRIGVDGVAGVRARVRDPEGVVVLFVDDASVRLDTGALVRSLLAKGGPIRIDLRSVTIAHADVALDANANGELRLARAFATKDKTPAPAGEVSRGVAIDGRAVALRHAWVHGAPPGAPTIDAELGELTASGHYDPTAIRAAIDHLALTVRGAPLGLDPKGTLHGSYGEGDKRVASAVYDGSVGGMPTTLEAKMDGERVDARLDVEDATGKKVAALAGELPIHERVTLHAEAHGELPRVDAVAHVGLGAATADVHAAIATGDATQVDATLALRRFDLRAVAEGAPASNLGVDARANVTLGKDSDVRGSLSADVLPSRIADTDTPKVVVRGTFVNDAVDATVRIDDPAIPTQISIVSAPVGKGRTVDARLDTVVADLRRLPKAGNIIEGRAHAVGSAHVVLPAKTIDATVSVEAAELAKAPLRIATLVAKADVHGTIDRPVVDAEAHARGIASANERVDHVDARAQITKAPGALVVKDALVEGLGEPIRAEIVDDANGLRAMIAAPRVDVARAAALAGKTGVRGGVAIVTDLTLRHDTAEGEVHVRGAELASGQLSNGTLVMDAGVHGRTIDFSARADLGQAGYVALGAERLTVTGDLANPATFRRTVGRLAVDGDFDLATAATLVPESLMPVGEVRGRFIARGSVRRDRETSAPDMNMHVHTSGLVVAAKTPTQVSNAGTKIAAAAPWRSAGVDLGLDLGTDTASGLGTVALRLTDRRGAIVAIDGKTVLSYTELLGVADAREKLIRAPIAARVVVAKRPLSTFPSVLGIGDLPGDLDADLRVEGTVLEPRVDFVAHGRGVRLPGSNAKGPADGDLAVAYDGSQLTVAAKVRDGEAELLDASSHVDVKVADLVEARGGAEVPWRAGAHAKLSNFPLEALPGATDHRVRGRVSGEATLERLREDASLRAVLDLTGFRVGRAKYERARIEATAGGGQLTAKARFDQKDGFADVNVSSGLAWGAELVPELDPSRPLEARLKATAFRAAVIEPFTGGAVDSLDGRIDADALAKIDPAGKDTHLEGKITLREGRVQVAAIGDELRDIRATVLLAESGTIRVDDLYARASQGELTGDALIQLAGLRLASAKASLKIPKKKAIDLALEGESIGDVWGDVSLDAKSSDDGKTTTLVVDVPSLNVDLATLSRRDVQPLEEKKKIRVGTYRDAQTFDILALDKEDLEPKKEGSEPTRLEIDVRLGNVVVERRNMLKIAFEGNPKIAVGGETRITGQIRVREGKVDVQGKQFKVEKGTLTFNGESPPNPVVVATAAWSSYDGTRVYADFTGPVKGGKLDLRSEPARPKNEILAMVLFGTADGANAPPSSGKTDNTTQAAVGLAGGVAAQGLTEALDDLAGIRASARIDMTRASNPRPEVEFQLTQRVSIEFAHVLGTPPLSEPDKNLGTIDWRFRANWSLETTIGDRGTTIVDAIWLKRY